MCSVFVFVTYPINDEMFKFNKRDALLKYQTCARTIQVSVFQLGTIAMYGPSIVGINWEYGCHVVREALFNFFTEFDHDLYSMRVLMGVHLVIKH